MRRRTVFICIIAALLVLVSSCAPGKKENDVPSVVVTIFPEYDWVLNILGELKDGYEVSLILDKGVDIHNFQPTVDDMLKIRNADMFIYVGGESDAWVEDLMKGEHNSSMLILDLMEILKDDIREEEMKEGMTDEDEEEGEEGPEYDEHVWLSLRFAEKVCGAIRDAFTSLDKENADIYEKNFEAYALKLRELDRKYKTTVASSSRRGILIPDRFPFRYMTEDYGLDYHAAFKGCSAESEASFETIRFLSEKLKELGLRYVIITESSDGKLADTVIRDSGTADCSILVMDSMQSTTLSDYEEGSTYLKIMEENLQVLEKALGE